MEDSLSRQIALWCLHLPATATYLYSSMILFGSPIAILYWSWPSQVNLFAWRIVGHAQYPAIVTGPRCQNYFPFFLWEHLSEWDPNNCSLIISRHSQSPLASKSGSSLVNDSFFSFVPKLNRSSIPPPRRLFCFVLVKVASPSNSNWHEVAFYQAPWRISP